jgi:hypothetical protein
MRPYGASLWSRWPEFGIYLSPKGTLTHWRGQRDERAWPEALERSDPWPWAVATAKPDAESDRWSGPTKCMEAILAYLKDHPLDEVSKSAMSVKLRALGLSYRNETIAVALEQLAEQERVAHRLGPRNAHLYRHLEGVEQQPLRLVTDRHTDDDAPDWVHDEDEEY